MTKVIHFKNSQRHKSAHYCVNGHQFITWICDVCISKNFWKIYCRQIKNVSTICRKKKKNMYLALSLPGISKELTVTHGTA